MSLLESIPSSNSGQAIQYNFIKNAILSPTEASANIVQIHSQRYTAPGPRAPGKFVSTVAQLSYPFSRGSSHITSSSPASHPIIDFAYLSHPLDIEILARHTLQTENILSRPPLSSHIKRDGIRLPADFPKPTSLEDAKKIIERYAATNYHPCGTCAMMKKELGGVVDEELKVYGVKGLRVVDASVFPIIPRGNILTTVYAVAEKTADILLDSINDG
jgi:choline dehydrogenase-like flavoprotein